MTVFSRPTNVSGPVDFFIRYLDQITGGAWSPAISIIVFGVVFLTLNERNSVEDSYTAASFSTLVTVVMLVALGGMSSQALVIAIMMVVIGVVVSGGNT